MTTFNLTCEAVEATLPDYLDESLEPWLSAAIDDHLAGCARCTNLVRELRNLAHEASAMPAVLPDEDVWPNIAGRIGAPDVPRTVTDVPTAVPDVATPVADVPETMTQVSMVMGDVPEIVFDSAAGLPQPEVEGQQNFAPTPETEPGPPAIAATSDTEAMPLDREVPLAGSELFVEASAPPPVMPSDLATPQVSDAAVPPFELLPFESEPAVTASDSFGQVSHSHAALTESSSVDRKLHLPASELEREVPLPTSDSPIPMSAPAGLADVAPAPDGTVIPITSRREKVWLRRRTGLAAAALVIVTAGTTFLLTVQWLGTSSPARVASDTRAAQRSPARETPEASRRRTRANGTEAPAPQQTPTENALVPSPPTAQLTTPLASAPTTSLTSASTVSLTSAPPVPRSPEDAVYDNAIVGLQKIVRRQERQLDPSTIAEIEENLRTIDAATGQIRAALQKDPKSSILDDQSSRVLEMKVELLRKAAMLHAST